MEEQEEKIGVWNLPEPTDAEEIAYLRHANALLRESIQHQSQLFDNVKAAIAMLETTAIWLEDKSSLIADEKADLHMIDNHVQYLERNSEAMIETLDSARNDIRHVMLLLGGA